MPTVPEPGGAWYHSGAVQPPPDRERETSPIVSEQQDDQGPRDAGRLDEGLSVLSLAVASGGLVDPRAVVQQHPELVEPAALERLRWFLLLAVAQGNGERRAVFHPTRD